MSTKFVPLTTRPASTSRQGMTRLRCIASRVVRRAQPQARRCRYRLRGSLPLHIIGAGREPLPRPAPAVMACPHAARSDRPARRADRAVGALRRRQRRAHGRDRDRRDDDERRARLPRPQAALPASCDRPPRAPPPRRRCRAEIRRSRPLPAAGAAHARRQPGEHLSRPPLRAGAPEPRRALPHDRAPHRAPPHPPVAGPARASPPGRGAGSRPRAAARPTAAAGARAPPGPRRP